MGKDLNRRDMGWTTMMADMLIREIVEQMSGARLIRVADPPDSRERLFSTVYTTVDGAYTSQMSFFAEQSFAWRIARGMTGKPEPEREEMEDYFKELFNVFCGRFISQIHRATHIPGRFYPPKYRETDSLQGPGEESLPPRYALYYQSDGGELAGLHWTAFTERPGKDRDENMSTRIMVVDDSRMACLEIEKMLEGTDIEVAEFCRSGEDALKRYAEVRPDVVTMDIVLPGMDGLDATRKLLTDWPGAKIVVVSSLAYDATIQSAAALGVEGFLTKPLERSELIKLIHCAAGAADGAPAKE